MNHAVNFCRLLWLWTALEVIGNPTNEIRFPSREAIEPFFSNWCLKKTGNCKGKQSTTFHGWCVFGLGKIWACRFRVLRPKTHLSLSAYLPVSERYFPMTKSSHQNSIFADTWNEASLNWICLAVIHCIIEIKHQCKPMNELDDGPVGTEERINHQKYYNFLRNIFLKKKYLNFNWRRIIFWAWKYSIGWFDIIVRKLHCFFFYFWNGNFFMKWNNRRNRLPRITL